MSRSELLSHADGVGEGLMLSSPSLHYNNVRARDVVLTGRSKPAEFLCRYMVACVELYRTAKKAI